MCRFWALARMGMWASMSRDRRLLPARASKRWLSRRASITPDSLTTTSTRCLRIASRRVSARFVLPGVRAANASARHHHCGRGGREPPASQGLLPLRLRPQARLAAHLIAAPQSVSASVRILPLAGTFWTFFGLPAGGFLHSLEGFGQYGGIWQSRFLH